MSVSDALKGIVQKIKLVINITPSSKKLLSSLMFVIILYELVKVIPPIIFKEIIDWMVKFDPANPISAKFIIYLILGYFGSLILMTFIEILARRTSFVKIINVEIDLLLQTLKKLFVLDLNYHERNNTGTSISKVLKGGNKIIEVFFNLAETLIPSLIQTAITLGILVYINWVVAASFLFFVPLYLAVLILGSYRTQSVRERYNAAYDEFVGVANQSMANIRTVKDFDNEDKEIGKIKKILYKYNRFFKKRVYIGYNNMMWEDAVTNTARFVTLALSVWLMFKISITAGELVLIVTLSEKAYLNLSRLSRVYYRIQDAEPSIDRIQKINDEPILLVDNPKSKRVIKEGQVEFDNVTFKYDKIHALKKVNFKIPAKSVTAFVGRSGAGKSTVIKLILRHFDKTSGEIKIDGIPIQDYSFNNLRAGITIVSQDVELFNNTIAANIAYGVSSPTKKRIIAAAKQANAHDFITQLPKGYDTIIGERGIKLSGGQKQRLAIARALIKKPKIIIFDEATSSLDSESEKFIHKSITKLAGQVTLILIAHRFSTIEHADQIILLEKGKVKEIGTHEQLMAKGGIFAKLRKLQELGAVRADKPPYHTRQTGKRKK